MKSPSVTVEGDFYLMELCLSLIHILSRHRLRILGSATRSNAMPIAIVPVNHPHVKLSLIHISVSGIVMIKGPKGLWGRGGIELVAGILIPILFLACF